MKNSITILLLTIAMNGVAQVNISDDPLKSCTSKFTNISISDFYKPVLTWDDNDSLLVVNDSLKAIKELLKLYLKIQGEQRIENERFRLAYNILSYIKMDGTITNWRKFNVAVKEYQQFNKTNP